MKRFLFASLLILGFATGAFAQSLTPGAQDILYFSKTGPVLLRVAVEIDGKSVQDIYRDYLKKTVAYYDRDKDGMLNAQELVYIPKGTYAANMFRYGSFYPYPNMGLTMADFNKGIGDKVSLDDLAAYLEKFNIAAVQPITAYGGGAPKNQASNSALFRKLDADGDGKLSKKEVAAARKSLLKFDLNDDEMITMVELTGNANPNFGGGGGVVIAPQPVPGKGGLPVYTPPGTVLYAVMPNSSSQMSALIMSRYDKDKDYKLDLAETGLAKSDFEKLDRDQNGSLSITEVMHWNRIITAIPMTLRIGTIAANKPKVSIDVPADKLPKSVQVKQAGPGQTYLMMEEAKVSLVGVANPNQAMMAKQAGGQFNYLNTLFKQANKQNKEFIQVNDLIGPQMKILADSFNMLDRNGDGKLTEGELEDYATLQVGALNSYASVRVAEESQDLFQVLDVNKDGKLSLNEMIYAWDNLSVLDRDQDGLISVGEFSQQYVVTIGQGQMNYAYNPNPGGNPLQPPVGGNKNKTGPSWFQKMDTNGDGYVSEREFLGTSAQFQKFDTNGDLLIDAQEAQRVTQVNPKKGD